MNTLDLSLFIKIAEMGSITEAARQFELTTPAVSSSLRRLEKQLDVQLFIRTTRQLRITSEGEQFLFHCRQALDSLEQGKIAVHYMQGKISGTLRLSVSSDLGRNIILPWIDEFADLHPSLSIDLNVGYSLSDFFMDQVDVALRYEKPEDSTMVSFHIKTVDRITCASPDYIAMFGEPLQPNDLKNHHCLLHRRDGRLLSHWQYVDKSQNYKIKVMSNKVSNDTDIVKRWAISGKGIAYRSKIDISEDLRNGKLIQLLANYQSPSVELHLICPSRKQVTPAVIAFRELLRERLK